MSPFKFVNRRVANVIGGTLLVASVIAVSIRTLAGGNLHYRNYWGGMVFAPFILLIVILIIGGVIAGKFRGRTPETKLRGRAARKARQAENTKFPIDDYHKW